MGDKGCGIITRIDQYITEELRLRGYIVPDFFINSWHTVFGRITAVFADGTLWPPNIRHMMSLLNLTLFFHFQTLIFHHTANIFHKNKLLALSAKY